MLEWLRSRAVSLLESHPYGYALGVRLVTATICLAHERLLRLQIPSAAGRIGLFSISVPIASPRAGSQAVPGWNVLSVDRIPYTNHLQRLSQKDNRFRYRMAAIDHTSGSELTLYVPFLGRIPLHSSAAVTLAEARSGIELSFPRQASRVRYVEFTATTTTIDDLNVDPQIIKFDIQGKELDALKGASRTLTNSSPDLLIEITFAKPSSSISEPFGYRPYVYEHATARFGPYLGGRHVSVAKRRLLEANLADRFP